MCKKDSNLIMVKSLPSVNIRSKNTYILCQKDGDRLPNTFWNFRNGEWVSVDDDFGCSILLVAKLPTDNIDSEIIYILTAQDGDRLPYTMWLYNGDWQQISKSEQNIQDQSIDQVQSLPLENPSEKKTYLLTKASDEKPAWTLWNILDGKWFQVAANESLLKQVSALPLNDINPKLTYQLMQADGDKPAFTLWSYVASSWVQIAPPNVPSALIYRAILDASNGSLISVLESTFPGETSVSTSGIGIIRCDTDSLYFSLDYTFVTCTQVLRDHLGIIYIEPEVNSNTIYLKMRNKDGTQKFSSDASGRICLEIRLYPIPLA